MIFFSTLIFIAWFIIIGFNIIFNIFNLQIWKIILITVVCTMGIIAIDGITAAIIRLLPKKWFSPKKKCFNVFKWEKNIYQKIGIKKWKDWVPELGHLTKFRKNKIEDPNNNEYIERFLLEINYGRIGHFTSFITGFLITFAFPFKYFLNFVLPVALVNIFMNSLSWMILRYNYPKLMSLYKRNQKLQI